MGRPHSTFDSRIDAVFWQNSRGHSCWGLLFTCTDFLLFSVRHYRAVGTICSGRRFFSYAAGGLGPLNLLQKVQGRGLVGVQGAKPLGAPGIWYFKVQNTAQKLNFVVQFLCKKWIKKRSSIWCSKQGQLHVCTIIAKLSRKFWSLLCICT